MQKNDWRSVNMLGSHCKVHIVIDMLVCTQYNAATLGIIL